MSELERSIPFGPSKRTSSVRVFVWVASFAASTALGSWLSGGQERFLFAGCD
ncbi:unnamed protein product [Ectocarpus sp. CCAP 1310/34]|nr:unnamed protein product [Ectocarpus sp. CCAP 1310/34]